MKIAGVHGLFSLGVGSTDLLLDLLYQYGHDTREMDWGPRGPIGAALVRGHVARRLIHLHADVVVAHSYGCAIVAKAMELGAHFRLAVLFNPALPSDYEFPHTKYGKIHVVANEQDTVLKLAQCLLGYGDMGVIGYHGDSPHVMTHFGPDPKPAWIDDHGKSFEVNHIARWARFINDEITKLETAA